MTAKNKNLVTVLFLLASFFYLYKEVFVNLVNIWSSDGNYSHGFFVPIIVGYIVWIKREILKATPFQPFWPALMLVFLSGFFLIAGQLAIHGFMRNFSFILMIFSITLLIFGRSWTRRLLSPMVFLIFMFPLPQFLRRGITAPLQLFSSYISVHLLSMMNFTVLREGNIIQLPDITLSVAEACSGLRSLVALTFLASVAAYFVLKSNWKRLFLILCAIPIAVILNWARITGTVLLINYWGIEVALSFFHSFSGLIIFAAAAILIGFILLFLRSKENLRPPSQTSDITPASIGNSIRLSALISTSALLILLSLYSSFLFSLKPGPPVNLQSFPIKLGPYVGKENSIEPSVTKSSSVTQDRSISFYNPDKTPISLYLGYYRTGRALEGFFHGSDVCLPGSGWKIIKKEKVFVSIPGHISSPVGIQKYISKKLDANQVLLTWFQAGDVIGTDSRKFRLRYAWDTIIKHCYNDTIKVMVQTIQGPKENEKDVTNRLIEFLDLMYPELNKIMG